MSFKSFLASTAERCGDATREAFHAAAHATKAAVDNAITKSRELEKATEQKITRALQEAERIERQAVHTAQESARRAEETARKAAAQAAKTLHEAMKKVKEVQEKARKTFSKKHIKDVILSCPRIRKGLEAAKEEAEKKAEIKFKNAVTALSGKYNEDYLAEPKDDGFKKGPKVKVGWEMKKARSLWAEKDGHTKREFLSGEYTEKGGFEYDPKKLEAKIEYAREVAGAVYKQEAEGAVLHNMAKLKGAVEVLSGKAGASGILEANREGIKAGVEAGAEANLIKGEVSGGLRITPKTLWDNTGGALFGCEAPKWLDYGLVAGATGEAGIGGAIKGSASVEATAKQVTGTLEGKIGFGPMAGLKITGGFAFPGEGD